MTKDQERLIRNARYQERQERNNPWSEPAVTTPRRTDAEILAEAEAEHEHSVFIG